LGRDLPHMSRPAVVLTRPPIQGILDHSRWKSGRSVALTTHNI